VFWFMLQWSRRASLSQHTVADGIQESDAYPWGLFLDGHGLVADNIIWGSPPQYLDQTPYQMPKYHHLPRRICYSKPALCNPLLQVLQYLTGVSIFHFLKLQSKDQVWSQNPATLITENSIRVLDTWLNTLII
jgi:hypothetical protein